jgi:hypothetical protein
LLCLAYNPRNLLLRFPYLATTRNLLFVIPAKAGIQAVDIAPHSL